MWFSSLRRSRTSTRAPRGRAQHSPAASRCRPQLENLLAAVMQDHTVQIWDLQAIRQ
jgi:hypothetical protein